MLQAGVVSVLSALLWILARLPVPLQKLIGELAGRGYALGARRARSIIRANVLHVAEGLESHGLEPGDPDEFATRNLRTSARLLTETAVCWRGPEEAWRSMINRVVGDDALEALHAANSNPSRGVLLLSPHLGNWELLNMYLGAEFGLTVLYDPPKIRALDPLIRTARERTASTVLPIGPTGLKGLVQRLKAGGVVGLLPDQVPAQDAGVYVPFYGKQALTINLVHRLASRHKPRVFMVCAIRNPAGSFDIFFDEFTDAACGESEQAAAAAMNAVIERRVASAPEQYLWSYKRFKRPPPGEPDIYR